MPPCRTIPSPEEPLQQGLRHLQTAFTNFLAGLTKYPSFKKKHQGGSAKFTKSAFHWSLD